MPATHVPVLLEEVIKFLDPKPNQNFIDGTLGDGGHAEAILERIGPEGKLLGFDLDEQALKTARERLKQFEERLILVRKNFSNMAEAARETNFPKADGILLDLGLRAAELEESGQGFSFERDEPLDMRFGGVSPSILFGAREETAADVINNRSAEELQKIFRDYGEERLAREIAAAIVERRQEKAFATTTDLREIILAVYRAKLKSKKEIPWIGGIHPATKVFQALRIEVNKELQNLRQALEAAPDLLAPHGRIAVISFHSLEDRIVKRAFRDDSRIKALTKKPITPSEAEIARNRRARSAKLRVAEYRGFSF